MSLRLAYQTPRDESLPHQVVIYVISGELFVSCNCLKLRNSHWPQAYYPMGRTGSLDDSRELYNDPDNHKKPFDLEVDGAKW